MNASQLKAGDTIISDKLKPDTVDLFLYSAAAWITHRTHFEKEFAIAEGHEGVLVHGPLQGAYMIERLHDWAAKQGGKLKVFQYRHMAPIVANTDIVISGTVEDVKAGKDGTVVKVAMAIDKASGQRCTAGHAEVSIPAKA